MKIFLIDQYGTIRETYKTSLRKNNPNPIVNEITVFKVLTKEIKSIQIRIVLYELVNDTKEFKIGHILLGAQMKAQNQVSHWELMLRMLTRPVIMRYEPHSYSKKNIF